ncbi:MAG: ABC transporter permease [Bryobacterales bacterium]|nr:ABC transporter permease [Bryobacterales bacterium]
MLRIATAAGLAADSIRAHKLRSALTLLGIVIGVGSVVLVGAAIEGLGSYAEESTSKVFGTDSFLVAQVAVVGRSTRSERAAKLRRNKRIGKDELDYLRTTTGDEILYSPYRVRIEDVKRGDRTYEGASILGVAAALADIREVAVEQGRFFTEQEERNRQNVCVIGDEIRTTLFAGTSPLEQKIKIRGIEFTVVGVQEKLGSMGGQSQDNQVYVPSPVFTRLFGPERSMAIFGRPRPDTGMDLASGLDVTRVALRTRFKTKPGADDNFDTLTPDSIRGFIDQILGLVAAVVVPVTGISLVVGGIVVMNIMLVSVTERTREIGIRKSVGARRSDIQLQFLTEAVMLAAMGGLIGLTLGWGAAALLGLVLEVQLPVTATYVVLALVVSSLTGIISGWYPASRAARLDPVVALRAE